MAQRPTARSEPAVVAVLAGGAGRRLGGSKAARRLAGRPLISYPLASAQRAGLQAIVLAKARSELPELHCQTVREPDLPRHPLCGIIAALEHAQGPVLAIGCDMPFLGGALIGWMAHLHGPAIAAPAGRAQPLLARWVPEQLPLLRNALRRRAAMSEVVAALGPTTIDDRELERFGDPELLCLNVNNAADLARAERLAREIDLD